LDGSVDNGGFFKGKQFAGHHPSALLLPATATRESVLIASQIVAVPRGHGWAADLNFELA
jgi:hypothetical protein